MSASNISLFIIINMCADYQKRTAVNAVIVKSSIKRESLKAHCVRKKYFL